MSYTRPDESSGALPAPPYQSSQAYHSQWHQQGSDGYSGGSGTATPTGRTNPNQSPFETVFDDHMYPVGAYRQASGKNSQTTSQQDLGTGYYGTGGDRYASSDENVTRIGTEDGIPLRARPGAAGGVELADHVYDAPQGGVGGAGDGKQQRGPLRFGELGMYGAGRRRVPWVVYFFTLVQVGVFIAEIVRNGILTGTPIAIKPSFNVMIGPSMYVMINMGSRFMPCMHNVVGVQSSTVTITWSCPNTTTSDAECTLSELCGFGGVAEPNYDGDADQSPQPNQWFRFIIPMFMHSGLIHIGFNMLMQLTMGRDMERAIGPVRFFLVYVTAGIFGFVLGGNYAATGISSTGASGSLFGIMALTLLDLLYSWHDRRSPVKELMFILLDAVISFVLGLLPGLDNFSHIGGFFIGLALGISVLHSPNALRRRIGEEDASYAAVNAAYASGASSPVVFLRNPVAFFKDRRPLWWAWWLLRAGAIVLVIVFFVLLLKNFYVYRKTCGWCKYLSCLPVNNWCDLGNLSVTNTTTSKRDLGDLVRLASIF